MTPIRLSLSLLLGLLLVLPSGAVDFVHEVAPILKENCAKCHMGEKHKGGFSMNNREDFLKENDGHFAIEVGNSSNSLLIKMLRSTSEEEDERMPPKGERMKEKDIALVAAWIDAGAPWEPGFTFKKSAYEAPLKLTRPVLPAAKNGREHPLDRILDAHLTKIKTTPPAPIDEAAFVRRVHLDITGVLPRTDFLKTYLADADPAKRAKLIDSLLADRPDYSSHWLTFWNDLLRNDYTGTGYITGGRSQISEWLYRSLLENKPYNQLASELISASGPSAGFANGIKWRGEVSAGQTVPIQYAQSVGQAFLGINLKCASCHDSFTDNWKLTDSYGLAAAFSNEKLEIARCDKPIGKIAVPYWLYPELGKIDASKPPAERLKQVAELTTMPANGRFSRTIVNRFWHRLMGRGIVHPVDAMSSEPWNEELLDYLALYLVENNYDLKKVIALICTSQAYQSKAEALMTDDESKWKYAGPRAKRMTAEEMVDAFWQITGSAPPKPDFSPPQSTGGGSTSVPPASWVWIDGGTQSKAGETIALKKIIELKADLSSAVAAVSCDNEFILQINGKDVSKGNDWAAPVVVDLKPHLRKGTNEIMVIATNGGSGPNPAGCYFQAMLVQAGATAYVGSDNSWQVTTADGGKVAADAAWHPAVKCANQQVWNTNEAGFQNALARLTNAPPMQVRASLMKSDELMRSLGRPNREQIVTSRPNDLTTLEAMDLNNGNILAGILTKGAQNIISKHGADASGLIDDLYLQALSRLPTPEEKEIALQVIGTTPQTATIEDFLWSVFMLPEFQLIR